MFFAFVIILMLALGTVLYLMVRALPRITEDAPAKESFLDRWARSEVPEKIDAAINGFLVKLLRRVKVVVLKFDNAVSAGLRKAAGEKAKRPGFDVKEIADSAGSAEEKKNGADTTLS